MVSCGLTLVTIETRKNSVVFSVTGDIASGSIEKKENTSDKKADQVLVEVSEPVKNLFSLPFLNSFNKAAGLSDQVTLKLSENIPLAVEYKIDNLGTLEFYLAPKLNDE